MFNSPSEIVLSTQDAYSANFYACEYVDEGKIAVFILQHPKGHDVWNIHPLRKGWQKVYTLEHCNPKEQVVQSLAALKRLFEN